MPRKTYFPADWAAPDHDARWRPAGRRGPECGYVFRGTTCAKRGNHYCAPRADRVVAFFGQLLVHTRGVHVRTAFRLAPWQEHEIIRPLFGEVKFSQEIGAYARRFRIAYIIVARKNGKSELAAGIQLYMLMGDDEEAAEVYSAAKDTKQAAKVFDPALRMAQLSPHLRVMSGSDRISRNDADVLLYNRNARRLAYSRTASYYEILTSDAAGELGHNPHSFNLDEVLALPDGGMWNTMTTSVGARAQELIFATTTETHDSISFGAGLIDEAERIQEDPARAPHVFVFCRKLPGSAEGVARLHRLFPNHPHLPVSTDWFDPQNWKWPNPALDGFKSRESMERQAMEAKDDPEKENAFRQFHVNQRVQQTTRFISMDLWDACTGDVAPNPDWWVPRLQGDKCWAGLDLSSKLDLTAWCLVFEGGETIWRFWVPESVVLELSAATGGHFERWVRAGWVVPTDGDTIDYDRIHSDLLQDAERYAIQRITYDRWSGEPVRQRLEQATGLEMIESGTTFSQMTGPMQEALRVLRAKEMLHGGNPVARWMADNLVAKRPRDDPDRVRPVKPERSTGGVRIDGMPAWFFALDGRLSMRPQRVSAYESRRLLTI